jgi:hypothetical protein
MGFGESHNQEKGYGVMPLLIWKEEFQAWGCEDCEYVARAPHAGESVGEYVATIRNHFDAHGCETYPKKPQPRISGPRLVAKARMGT